MVVLWIALAVVAVLVVAVPVHYFNRGVTLRNRCRESFSNIETELRRRYELIPNLVAVVQGYAKHERAVLEQVTSLRSQAMADHGDPGHQADTERPLVRALERLVAVAEDNPALRADRQFLALQDELAITEDRIQAARRFYNGNVRAYRDHTHQFPGNLFARVYRFRSEPFFEVDPVHVAHPGVAP